jgi:hypothetical protein
MISNEPKSRAHAGDHPSQANIDRSMRMNVNTMSTTPLSASQT